MLFRITKMFFKTEPDIITTTQWQRWYTVYDVRDNDSCLKLQQMFITIQKSVTPFFKHLQMFFYFCCPCHYGILHNACFCHVAFIIMSTSVTIAKSN